MFYNYQQHFYFQPKKNAKQDAYQFPAGTKYQSVSLPFDSATKIDVVKFLPADTVSKGVVLFFHGNRFNVDHYSSYAHYFTKHGYECWMPDYPGYGRSTGEMNVDLLETIAMQLYKMARVNNKPGQIIIYGKSLGTGIAAYLASVRDCRALLLETPYHSLSSLTSNYIFFMPVHQLVKYNLDTYTHFKDITAPITIIHGDKDEVIPLPNAFGLLNDMKQADAFYIVRGGQHNTLPQFPLYQKVVDSVMLK